MNIEASGLNVKPRDACSIVSHPTQTQHCDAWRPTPPRDNVASPTGCTFEANGSTVGAGGCCKSQHLWPPSRPALRISSPPSPEAFGLKAVLVENRAKPAASSQREARAREREREKCKGSKTSRKGERGDRRVGEERRQGRQTCSRPVRTAMRSVHHGRTIPHF